MSAEKRRYRAVMFYVFLILGAFLIGIFIFNAMIMPRLVGRRDVTIVPDIRGMSIKLAEERCRDRGFNLVTVGQRNSDEVPAGYIIEQEPSPEGGLKEGRAIRVVVSTGCRMETVPELRNESLRQAELLLENSGLRKGRIVRIFSHENGQNIVHSTSPPAGASVPHNSMVDILLVVREVPRVFLMPDLVGMDLPFVKDRLEKLGFHVARVVNRRVEEEFPNTILSQSPEAGCSIKEGGTIELVVSTVD